MFLHLFSKNSEVLERSRAPVFGVFLEIGILLEAVSLPKCVKSV